MKILIVEDELALQQSIASYLKKEDNICETASNFKEGLSKSFLYEYDIIILDINLINGTGLDILKLLKKENKNSGVIIISANNSLDDKLSGLDLGADDYLTKPFHLAELNSRINAVLRRRQFDGNHIIKFNEIEINVASRIVSVLGVEIILTRKEFDLLLFFVTNKKRVLSKEIIAEHLWGDHSDMMDNFDFIYVHINNLRKKLTQNGAKYIQTSYGIGYIFKDAEY